MHEMFFSWEISLELIALNHKAGERQNAAIGRGQRPAILWKRAGAVAIFRYVPPRALSISLTAERRRIRTPDSIAVVKF
jgi:hypothetical protein